MAENLGSIRYDVEVNTASTLKADTVVGKTTDSMVNNFKKVDNATKNLNTQVTKASAGVKRAMNANLGQAGIQVQQFVGQLQGGQSAMVALAQQSADLGIVLGAPLIGVFVSLAAVLAGTLAPAIFGSVSNIEKLQKAIENTKAVMTVGASGVAEYTEEIKRLNTASESLAKIKIALAMTENAEALKASKKEASALRAELIGFQEDATDAAKRLTGLTSSTNDILSLTGAMNDFNAATSDDKKLKALDTAEKALLNMRKNGVFPTKELAEYAAEFFTFSDATRQAIVNNKALSVSMDDIASSTKDAESQFKSIKDALRSQIIELNSGEEAALRYSLLLDGLNSDQIDQIITLTRKKKALEDEAEAVKLAQKANEDYKESIKSVSDELDAYFDKESSDSTKKNEREKGKASNFAQNIVDKARPESEVFADELEKLTELRLRGLLSQQLYDEAIVASVTNRADKVNKANEKNLDSQALFNQSQSQLLGSLGGLFGAFADNMEVQDKKSFEKKKKFQTAQALINTAMAISNALAAAPPPINFALAAASGAMGAIQVAAIQGQEYSGGREFGGPVSAGSMYRVGEKGKPEFYKDNLTGHLSMIPGENGEVIPADKMGGQMSVVINNNAAGVDVSANQVDARTIEISVNKAMQEFANQVRTGQGDAIRSLTSNTNVTRRG